MNNLVQNLGALTVRTAGLTHAGRVRQSNEDDFFFGDKVLVVADGMGGEAAGALASRMVVNAFQERAPAPGEPGFASEEEVEFWLRAAVSCADYSILDHSKGNGMGSTVVAAAHFHDRLHIVHVGDSRAYLLRSGRLMQLTEDHSLVAAQVAMRQITPAAARNHPLRSRLTRSVGNGGDPDHRTIVPTQGDLLLLCSDGLWGAIEEDRLEDILRKGAASGKPDEICDELVAEALAAGGPDNITVVVRLFGPKNRPVRVPHGSADKLVAA